MTLTHTTPNFHLWSVIRRAGHPLAVVAFFAGLVLITLHGQLFTTGTHVSGFDYFNYHWNFWFMRYSFAHPEVDLWFNDHTMVPALSNYGYHALAAAWYPLWYSLEPLVGTLAAVNVFIALACFLNGYVTYHFLRAEGVHPVPALIGGAAVQLLPITRYFYANTHLNLMAWFWLPGLALLWRQIARLAADRQGRRVVIWAATFGMALWGLLLTDLQFPIFAAFLLIPYGLWTAWTTARRSRTELALLTTAALIAVAFGLALMIVAGPLPAIAAFDAPLEPGAVEDRPGIPFPAGFLSMSPAWWEWNQPSLGAFVPLTVLAACLVGLLPPLRSWLPRRRWLWLVIATPPLIFALGPTLHLGDFAVPLPYRWLHALTDGNFRMPWRLGPVFALAGMVFVGLTVTGLLAALDAGRARRVLYLAAPAALILLWLAVRPTATAPLTPVPRDYALYHEIGRYGQPPFDRFAILDAPPAAGTGEVLLGDPRAIQLQWYALVHHRRTFNGFISRAPVDQFWGIMGDDPLMAWMGGRRALDPDRVRDALRQRMYGFPLGHILIHTDLIGRESPLVAEMVGFFNQQPDLLCHWRTEDDLIAYQTRTYPLPCPVHYPGLTTITDAGGSTRTATLDIGTPGDEAYLGWGWHYPEAISGLTLRWMGAAYPAGGLPASPRAVLYVDLPTDARTITIRAQAFMEDRQLTVTLDDELLTPFDREGSVTVTPDTLADYSFGLPPRTDALDHAEIALIVDAAVRPVDAGLGADERPLAISVERVVFGHE